MKTIIALLAALLVSAPSAAQDQESEPDRYFPQQLTAKDLSFYCASSSLTDRGRQRQKYCAGFVSGVEEAIRLLAMQGPVPQVGRICVPKGKTARQFTDVYLKYAARKTANLDRPAALVVIEALKETFPCEG